MRKHFEGFVRDPIPVVRQDPLGMRTDGQLAEELGTLLHPGVNNQEVERGCMIIETLMKREKSRRPEKWVSA